MNRFLVLIGWRRGPNSVSFGRAPFGLQLTLAVTVAFCIVALNHLF